MPIQTSPSTSIPHEIYVPDEAGSQPLEAEPMHGLHADPLFLDLMAENAWLVEATCRALELHAAADRALRQQAQFFAVVAHELRNPLTPISTATALLGRHPGDPLVVRKAHAVIERQALRIGRLIDDLVDFSHMRTGKLRTNMEVLDVAEILCEVVENCRLATDSRLQRLTLTIPDTLPTIRGDALRVFQIFTNLVENASKYTPISGAIDVIAHTSLDALDIRVRDTGIGIGIEMLPHIFEPFIQEAHAVALRRGGLGIGLTVVRGLVEAHGGTIDAQSKGHGQGSEFVVTLPLASA